MVVRFKNLIVDSQFIATVGSGYKDDSINLMPFFSASCYNGFTDDAKVCLLIQFLFMWLTCQ